MYRADGKAAYANFFADKINGHGVAHAQSGDFAEPAGDGQGRPLPLDRIGLSGLAGNPGDAFHQHPVHGIALLHDAGPNDGGDNFLHARQGKNSLLGGDVARHGHVVFSVRTRSDAYVARKLGHSLPDGMAEAGTHGYRDNYDKETDGDCHRRHVSLKSQFTRYESLRYQMCTRSSSGRYIGSPSWMSKASKKVWKLRMLTFTRFTARECGSRLVRRAFSWSVMFWAQMAA